MVVHERIIRDGIGVSDNHTPPEKEIPNIINTFIANRRRVAEHLLTLEDARQMLLSIVQQHPFARRMLMDVYLDMFNPDEDKIKSRKILLMIDLLAEGG